MFSRALASQDHLIKSWGGKQNLCGKLSRGSVAVRDPRGFSDEPNPPKAPNPLLQCCKRLCLSAGAVTKSSSLTTLHFTINAVPVQFETGTCEDLPIRRFYFDDAARSVQNCRTDTTDIGPFGCRFSKDRLSVSIPGVRITIDDPDSRSRFLRIAADQPRDHKAKGKSSCVSPPGNSGRLSVAH